MQQPFYIVFVAVYFLQQSKHAGQMLRVDVIKQQHHHGETHGKGAGVLKIRLQKFPTPASGCVRASFSPLQSCRTPTNYLFLARKQRCGPEPPAAARR